MKKYMIVIEIKPEFEKEYIELHLNPWNEMLSAIQISGFKNEAIFYYKNQSIIYIECDDDTNLEECNSILRATEVCKKWDLLVCDWFANPPVTCDKIFDLNQQIEGSFRKD